VCARVGGWVGGKRIEVKVKKNNGVRLEEERKDLQSRTTTDLKRIRDNTNMLLSYPITPSEYEEIVQLVAELNRVLYMSYWQER